MGNAIIITEQELSKVENSALNKEQLNFLFKKTPTIHIYERPAKGGGKWKYVKGVYVKKVLNLMFGWNWDFEVIEHKFDMTIKQAYVLGRLTVRSNGQVITKMQFGGAEIKFKTAYEKGEKVTTNIPLDIGNDLKAAATDSLKKCATDLGIASDVYTPDEYREVSIKDDVDMLADIKALLNDAKIHIKEVDRMYINKVIDDQDVKEYGKILNNLNSLKNSKK